MFLACVTPASSPPGPTPCWPGWLSHRPTQPRRWRAHLCAEKGQRVRASDATPGFFSAHYASPIPLVPDHPQLAPPLSLTPLPRHTSCLVTGPEAPSSPLPSSRFCTPYTQPPVGHTVKPSNSHARLFLLPLHRALLWGGGALGGGSLLLGEPWCAQANASSDGPWHLWASSAWKGAQVPTLHPLTSVSA